MGKVEGIEINPAGAHLWVWFWDLHRSRQAAFGPLPLAISDLVSWQAITGNIVRPEEWSIIRDMDDACLGSKSPRQASAAQVTGNEQPVSVAAFDAVFG